MSQTRSRKILIGIGAAFALALAMPFVFQAWTAHSQISGKQVAFEGRSQASHRDIFRCLLRTQPGGLALEVRSTDNYLDPARGVAVRIVEDGQVRTVQAWAAPGNALRPGEAAQLTGCLTPA